MQNTNWTLCRIVCCSIAAVIGLIVMLVARNAIHTIPAVLVGLALGFILYFVLTRLFCGDETVSEPETAPARAETPAPTAKPEPAAASKATPAPEAAAEAKTDTAPAVRSGTQLPGEEELASRKGTWRYQGGAATAAPKPAPAAPVAKGGEGKQPEGLAQARDGKPDDLKQIKGVGPKLEQLLNSMGYFHFDQIAAWTSEEVAWVDQNLKGFKGRVSRDGWVEQAKTLAAGGQTEFSKRVEDGDVY